MSATRCPEKSALPLRIRTVHVEGATERRTRQVVERGKWNAQHVVRWRRVDCGGVRARHCPVPLTHSPGGGGQWCRITRGVPTPRLLGVCGCFCEWTHAAQCAGGWRWTLLWSANQKPTSAGGAQTRHRRPARTRSTTRLERRKNTVTVTT